MKMRIGPLLGVGLGYLIGTGKAKELATKAKEQIGQGRMPGSGTTRSGTTGSGMTGSGTTGSGVTGSGTTGAGMSGSGMTGSPMTSASMAGASAGPTLGDNTAAPAMD